MKVGFIGLGRMGTAMAANLLKAGHAITVYNRSPDKARGLAELGAQVATRVSDACRGEAIITMLANDEAVHSVVFDDDGVLASAADGAVHISMSTISVALSSKLASAHAKARQRFIAAPVFGRPQAAAEAQLFIVAAGAKSAVDDCARLFDAIGQKLFYLGADPPAANLVKLSGNFLIASVIESLGEAIALIGKAGIDPRAYLDVLTSTLFNVPLYKIYGGLIVDRKFEPAGFAAPLGLKDIRLTLAAAEQLQVAMPVASLLRDRFLTLLARGGAAQDWSAIARLSAGDAGLPDAVLPDAGPGGAATEHRSP
jgi:3-hydroxyisobutyrate dehydrogenase-like beta-hydroxyacid dehydrogenase